jgi:hypothetical protein
VASQTNCAYPFVPGTGPIKRQRVSRLSHVERTELIRQLIDAVKDDLIRPNHNEFGSPVIFVCKVDGSLRLCIDYCGLTEVTRKDGYLFPGVKDTLDKLKDANFYTHLDLAFDFWQVRVREEDIRETAFETLDRRSVGLDVHAVRIVQCFSYISAKHHSMRLFTPYRYCRPRGQGSPGHKECAKCPVECGPRNLPSE